MIAQLAAILLPVFSVAGVGWAWRRLDLPFERDFVTRLIMNVAGPCLIVDSLSKLTLPLGEFLVMVAGSAAMLLVTAVAGYALLAAARLPSRSFLPSLVFGNAGNMGLPLALFAFGPEGLGLAMAVFITGSIGQFTLAPVFQSRASASRTLITTPVVYGSVAGVALLALDVSLPQWLATTIELLGALAIPLMLLALGNTLGGLRAGNLPLAVGLGSARLVLGFLIALGIAELAGLEGMTRAVLILQGAMPAAVFNYLLAARYERNPEEVAGVVLMSTFIGALLLPFLVTYVLWIAAH